jgi:hypothetical protein
MAEWQRLSNWLSSIKMDCYIPNFRDHGITKLSLLELFGDDDLYELGINAQDVPFIKQKVNEFASMIKSFAEEPVPIASNKHKHHRSAAGHHERKTQQEPVSATMEIIKPLGQRKKVYPPINDLDVFRKDLFHLFDESKFVEFFQLWEGFVHHYLSKEMVLLENLQSQQQQEDQLQQQQPHKPALYYAKQAIEFHLYIYFYIASIRKNLSKEILLLTKNSLKDYLEKLTIIYENNNNNFANPGDLPLQNLNDSISSPIGNGQHKPLISSKEFAAFAGLVFVPNPQENPAFHLLFKEDWTNALRQRLEQFLQVVFEESKRSQPLLASQSPDLLEMTEEIMNEVPVVDLAHNRLHHHHHNDDQNRAEQQQEESELVTPTKSSTNQILDRPFRSPEEEANHHDHLDHHQQHEGEAEEKKEESFQNLVSQTAEISPISHEGKPAVQSQPKVHNLKERLSLSLLNMNHHSHSGRPPAESPLSNASSISQLTDDTPLKNHDKSSPLKQAVPSLVNKKHLVPPGAVVGAAVAAPVVANSQFAIHHLPPAKQIVQLSPPQQPQGGFTFNKSGPLAEAANRANIRLRQLQNTTGPTTTTALPTSPPSAASNVLPTAVQPTMKIRAMNSSSPPKSLSLQSQVDNYNKLLKQHKLPKQPAAVLSQPQTPEQDNTVNHNNNNNNNIPPSSQILPTPPLIRVNSATLEDVNQNLLKEMDHPNNQDLLQQIDAIIAPLTNSPPSTGPGSFNIGFNLQRGGGGQVISPLPMMASGIKGLGAFNNSVSKYKNLLKSQSASSLSLNANENNNNKNEMSETSFLDAKRNDEENGEEMNIGQAEEKQRDESLPDERVTNGNAITSKPQERETFDEEVSIPPPAPPAPPVQEEEDQKSKEPHQQPQSLPVSKEAIHSSVEKNNEVVVDEEEEEGEEVDALNESFEVKEQPVDQPKANPSSNKKKKKKKHK